MPHVAQTGIRPPQPTASIQPEVTRIAAGWQVPLGECAILKARNTRVDSIAKPELLAIVIQVLTYARVGQRISAKLICNLIELVDKRIEVVADLHIAAAVDSGAVQAGGVWDLPKR